VRNPEFKYIYNDGKINIYANPAYLPRAFLVPECMIINDRARILEKLLDIDPRQVVILEAEQGNQQLAVSKQQAAEGANEVQIVQYQPNTVLIQTDTAQDGFLFLSDTYYPGWSARVDGVKTRIYRANYAFRAIYLKAGQHRVEFRYMPDSLLIGCWTSLISILLCLTGGWYLARKDTREIAEQVINSGQ
ncbi:MAG: YfhO family protein, partial [Candidatus Desantisbacteria bacterium]